MKVSLIQLYFSYGTSCIGIVSFVLFGLSYMVLGADAKMIRGAATLGVLVYIGSIMAKAEYNKDRRKQEIETGNGQI